MFGGLGLLLGLDSAALTVVALRCVGDDPLLSGGPAALFFVMFGLGMAVIVYVMLEATLMTVTVAGQQLTVSMGVFGRRRSWPIDGMAQVAMTRHSLVRHGGRGSVFAPSSRRAWVMFGIKDGVEFESEYQDGKTGDLLHLQPPRPRASIRVDASRLDGRNTTTYPVYPAYPC